jgi:hypothetical protein
VLCVVCQVELPRQLLMMSDDTPIVAFGSYKVPLNLRDPDSGQQVELAVQINKTYRCVCVGRGNSKHDTGPYVWCGGGRRVEGRGVVGVEGQAWVKFILFDCQICRLDHWLFVGAVCCCRAPGLRRLKLWAEQEGLMPPHTQGQQQQQQADAVQSRPQPEAPQQQPSA